MVSRLFVRVHSLDQLNRFRRILRIVQTTASTISHRRLSPAGRKLIQFHRECRGVSVALDPSSSAPTKTVLCLEGHRADGLARMAWYLESCVINWRT